MVDNFSKLAVEIHERDNKKVIGPCVGTVIKEIRPIMVSVCDGKVVLEQGENALVCQNLVERTYTAKVNGSAIVVTYQDGTTENVKIETDERMQAELKDVLKKGDRVFCVPCEGEQTWIIVDKVVS